MKDVPDDVYMAAHQCILCNETTDQSAVERVRKFYREARPNGPYIDEIWRLGSFVIDMARPSARPKGAK